MPRFHIDTDSYPCGHERTERNTLSRYGRDHCVICVRARAPELVGGRRKVNVGARYGMLIVRRLLGDGRARVVCDCGNQRYVWTGNLQKGSTASCGCTPGTHKFPSQRCALEAVWR